METKKWYLSKTVWFNVLTFLGSAGLLVADFLGAGMFAPQAFALLGVGLVNIVLRVWFTDTAIE